jgi:D-cysteine desulfhydrase family pyridoxal phosphate-dependent enzyme
MTLTETTRDIRPLTIAALAALLEQHPRVQLADLPTPLQECPRLSAAVGGPRILIKRDDMTGLALGGNKTRALEFVLGGALAQGADTLITSASTQSNHCRQTAAAGARMGLPVHLVLKKGLHNEPQGNLLLDELFGADVRIVDDGAPLGTYDMTAIYAEVDRLAESLRRAGRRPYVITMQGHSQPLAGGGYLAATVELEAQLAAAGARPTHLVVTSGSGGTHSSLALAVKALGLPYTVLGISIRKSRAEAIDGVVAAANRTAAHYGLETRLEPNDVAVYDEFFGRGYGLPTPEGFAAMKLVARTEGVLLDPVYTSKTMSGLVALTQRGALNKDDTVVFVHTGGIPALFAYHQEVLEALSAPDGGGQQH